MNGEIDKRAQLAETDKLIRERKECIAEIDDLSHQRQSLQLRLGELTTQIRGQGFLANYRQLCEEQDATKRKLLDIIPLVREKKGKLVAIKKRIQKAEQQSALKLETINPVCAMAYSLILNKFLDSGDKVVFSSKEKRLVQRLKWHYDEYITEITKNNDARLALVQKGDWLLALDRETEVQPISL